MAMIMEMKELPDQHVLINGETEYGGQSVFIILEGKAELLEGGISKHTYGPKTVIGDMLTNYNEKGASIRTVSKCVVYEMDHTELQEILFRDPDLIAVLGQIGENAPKEKSTENA